jgi:hypothetical protein
MNNDPIFSALTNKWDNWSYCFCCVTDNSGGPYSYINDNTVADGPDCTTCCFISPVNGASVDMVTYCSQRGGTLQENVCPG